MIFLNSKGELLLFLRDNKPDIRCPNMWDLPGGHREKDESAEACIRREMYEELPGINLADFEVFAVEEFSDRIDTIFWTRADLDIDYVNAILTEGQRAAWTPRERAGQIELAFDFGPIVKRFFDTVGAKK